MKESELEEASPGRLLQAKAVTAKLARPPLREARKKDAGGRKRSRNKTNVKGDLGKTRETYTSS